MKRFFIDTIRTGASIAGLWAIAIFIVPYHWFDYVTIGATVLIGALHIIQWGLAFTLRGLKGRWPWEPA